MTNKDLPEMMALRTGIEEVINKKSEMSHALNRMIKDTDQQETQKNNKNYFVKPFLRALPKVNPETNKKEYKTSNAFYTSKIGLGYYQYNLSTANFNDTECKLDESAFKEINYSSYKEKSLRKIDTK